MITSCTSNSVRPNCATARVRLEWQWKSYAAPLSNWLTYGSQRVAKQVVAAGIVVVAAVANGVGDERDHRPQERKVAPEPMTGRDMRSVELPGAGGPEPFARVVAGPQVEVDDLRAIDGREPHDLAGGDGKCVARIRTGTTISLSRRRRLELRCQSLDQRRVRYQRAVASSDVRGLRHLGSMSYATCCRTRRPMPTERF